MSKRSCTSGVPRDVYGERHKQCNQSDSDWVNDAVLECPNLTSAEGDYDRTDALAALSITTRVQKHPYRLELFDRETQTIDLSQPQSSAVFLMVELNDFHMLPEPPRE